MLWPVHDGKPPSFLLVAMLSYASLAAWLPNFYIVIRLWGKTIGTVYFQTKLYIYCRETKTVELCVLHIYRLLL